MMVSCIGCGQNFASGTLLTKHMMESYRCWDRPAEQKESGPETCFRAEKECAAVRAKVAVLECERDMLACNIHRHTQEVAKIEAQRDGAVGILREITEHVDGVLKFSLNKDRRAELLPIFEILATGISVENRNCSECALAVNGYEEEICRGCEDGAHFTPKKQYGARVE